MDKGTPDLPRDITLRSPPQPPKLLVRKLRNSDGKAIYEPIARSYGNYIRPIEEPSTQLIPARQTTIPPLHHPTAIPSSPLKSRVNSKYDSKSDSSIDLKSLKVERPAYPIPYIPSSLVRKESLLRRNSGSEIRVSNTVDPAHVPSLNQSDRLVLKKSVLADAEHPVVSLNKTWSSCWDDEVQAVYYYNKETGEATWIPP